MSKGYKISDGYVKRGRSLTDEMSLDDIKLDLQKYMEVSDISEVELLRHVRYFVWDKKSDVYKYRKGGFLVNRSDGRYVVLSQSPYAGNKQVPRWSVQREVGGHRTIFYRLLSDDEYSKSESSNDTLKLAEKYQKELKLKAKENERLKILLQKYVGI